MCLDLTAAKGYVRSELALQYLVVPDPDEAAQAHQAQAGMAPSNVVELASRRQEAR